MEPMVEDVGFEPRFKLPKLACYHYTTSSIFSTQAGVVVEPSVVNHLILADGFC